MTRQPVWKLNLRLLFISLLLLAMGGYLCWGLTKLSVEETESYQAAVRATSIVTTYQSGTRGTITDRYGNVLAYDETTYNVASTACACRRAPCRPFLLRLTP